MAMLIVASLFGAAALAVVASAAPAPRVFQSPECTADSASSGSIGHDGTSLLQVQGTVELGSVRSVSELEPKGERTKHLGPIEDLSDVVAYDEQAQQLARNAEEGFHARTFNRVKTDLATDEVAEEEARRQTSGDRLETTLEENAIGEHEARRLQAAELAHAARNEHEQVAAATEDMDAHVKFDEDYADENMQADTKETQMLRAKADAQAQAQAEAERQSVVNRIAVMGGSHRGRAHMSSSGKGMDTSVQKEGMVSDYAGVTDDLVDPNTDMSPPVRGMDNSMQQEEIVKDYDRAIGELGNSRDDDLVDPHTDMSPPVRGMDNSMQQEERDHPRSVSGVRKDYARAIGELGNPREESMMD